jgi:hypothetical protein
MRRHFIAAACIGSLALALLVGIVIRQHRRQVAQAQEAAAAQSRAQAELDALMRQLRERDARSPDASTKLISNPKLGDYPPEPPFNSGGPLPKGAPSRDPSSYGPGDRPAGHAP